MMLRAKLAAFAGTLILAGSTFASQEICPALDAIQAEGVSLSLRILGTYTAFQISKFNTDSNWGFVMGPLDVDSEDEAVENANDLLSEMTAPGVYIPTDGYDTCFYDTGSLDVFAIAVKDEFPTPMKLKQFINKRH